VWVASAVIGQVASRLFDYLSLAVAQSLGLVYRITKKDGSGYNRLVPKEGRKLK